MYVPDLTSEEVETGTLVYIGYLSSDRPYSMGEVADEFFERLCRFVHKPMVLVASAGFGRCSFCRFTGANGTTRYGDYLIPGATNWDLFIPGQDVLYVSPGCIAHYVDAHGYRPPDEFCDAILRCPDMRTQAYRKALLDNGGRYLLRRDAPN